jgi:hypothetical protein
MVAAMVTAIVAASPGTASASAARHGPLRPAAAAAGSAGLSLAQAPAGLRAAVRRTPGLRALRAGSAFQQAKLTAAGGTAGDSFGDSVAISGSTAVVGAPNNNSHTGTAYVFTRSGSTWSQQAQLTDPGNAKNDYFGYSVAIAGSTVVVGAWGDSVARGAAYVFVRSGSTWSQQAKLTAQDGVAFDQLGWSVAISGSTVVAGAPSAPGGTDTGAAYVFVSSGGVWSQQAKLTASDGFLDDTFGNSVAISGSIAVVGAVGAGSKADAGAAYVFVRSGTSWSQQAELADPGGAQNDYFGFSVAIAGSTAVVGAPGSNSGTGAAYVFTPSATTWSQQAKLTAADGAAADSFGGSVAIAGSTAVVGAYGNNSGAGAAYSFTRSGTAWFQQAELTAVGGAAGDNFGGSVAISGSTAMAGAPVNNSSAGAAYVFVLPSQQAKLTATKAFFFGTSVAISGSTAVVGAIGTGSVADAGAAYVFVRSGSTWSRQATLADPGNATNDVFGTSVAIDGSTVVVGAPNTNSHTGAAYVFVRSGTTWSQQAKLLAADGAANDYFASSVAVSGSTAVVGAPDSTSTLGGAAYVFVRSGSTWSQQAKLQGADRGFGDVFGTSVAVSGSTAVVGAPSHNGNTGAAYVFVRSGTKWPQRAELTAADAAGGDQFGSSVAMSGSTVVVGAPYRNGHTGAAYAFVGSGRTWSQQGELTAADGAFGDFLGWSVAVSGSTAVAGAFGSNSSVGAAYVFVLGAGSVWSQQAKLANPSGVAGDKFGNSVAIAKSSAMVGAPLTNSNRGAAYVFANV